MWPARPLIRLVETFLCTENKVVKNNAPILILLNAVRECVLGPLASAHRVKFGDLEPYFTEISWSKTPARVWDTLAEQIAM